MFETSADVLWFPATCGRLPETSVGSPQNVLNKRRTAEDLRRLFGTSVDVRWFKTGLFAVKYILIKKLKL